MSNYTGPSVDPTNPHTTLRTTSELIRGGDFATAERVLGWALDFNPEHAGLLRRMSELRLEEGKAREALDWAERALAADRGDVESYAYLGLVHMRQGRYAEAAELLVRAVEIKPDNPWHLRRLADINVHLGRGAEAIALAERAATVRPDVGQWLFLAGLKQRYGDHAGAEATLTDAAQHTPENSAPLRRLAELHMARGDLAAAEQWATQAS
jgi:tetratricopeptide (TPR) repeat protein